MAPAPPSALCPCGSGSAYAACCEPYVAGWEPAPTALALMRSRYTAYARGEADYLVDTHAPETRTPTLREDVAAWSRAARFTRLEIVSHEAGGPGDTTGTVTFVAHFVERGAPHQMTERSRFRKDGERWLYVDGKVR